MHNDKIIEYIKKQHNTILKDTIYKMRLAIEDEKNKIDAFNLSSKQIDDIKLMNENINKILEIKGSYNFADEDNFNERNIDEDLTGTKVCGLRINGNNPLPLKTHKDALVKFCEYLYDIDKDKFSHLVDKMNNLFNMDSSKLLSPRLIKNAGIYVETQSNAKNIYRTIKRLSSEYQLDSNNIKVILE